MTRSHSSPVAAVIVGAIAIITILLLATIFGCRPIGGSDVIRAEAVDWVWGYEELRSGATRAWLRHDDIAGYCTSDEHLGSLIREYNGQMVVLEFKSSRWTGSESWNTTGCNRLSTGSDSSTPIFLITGIRKWDGD